MFITTLFGIAKNSPDVLQRVNGWATRVVCPYSRRVLSNEGEQTIGTWKNLDEPLGNDGERNEPAP